MLSSATDALFRDRLKTQRALYTLDMPALEWLQPDLIVTQALCDVCAEAEAEVTAAACTPPGHPKVVNLESVCLGDALNDLRRVARAAGQEARGVVAVQRLQANQRRRGSFAAPMDRPAVLLWPMVTGTGADRRRRGGNRSPGPPSRTLQWEEVVEASPEVLLIACCGFSVERTLVDMPILRDQPGWDDLPADPLPAGLPAACTICGTASQVVKTAGTF